MRVDAVLVWNRSGTASEPIGAEKTIAEPTHRDAGKLRPAERFTVSTHSLHVPRSMRRSTKTALSCDILAKDGGDLREQPRGADWDRVTYLSGAISDCGAVLLPNPTTHQRLPEQFGSKEYPSPFGVG